MAFKKKNNNPGFTDPANITNTPENPGTQPAPKGKLAKFRIPLIVAGCLLAAALLTGAVLGATHLYKIVFRPSALFITPSPKPTVAETVTPEAVLPTTTPSAEATLPPTPTPTLNPEEELERNADTSMMNNILNVLLVGVDYAPERETWSGKHEYHADVMMLCVINFDTGSVNLVSIPRDTYAKIPGVNGKYKINASINCGGGWPEGLTKTCEAASWMLGGIPVDYYYAVTMPVVKELVDVLGGVDYNIEMDFKLAGRSYKAGMQHLDGQGVLDYLRVRKNIEKSGDQNRINRQKQMMIALFKEALRQNLIVKAPDIVETFKGRLETNLSYSQTAALALFALKTDPDSIGMYSFSGASTDIYNWGFVLTDQKKRVNLIKDLYGVDVPQYKEYSRPYCLWEWDMLRYEAYTAQSKDAYQAIYKAFEEDLKRPEFTPSPKPTATPKPSGSPTPPTGSEAPAEGTPGLPTGSAKAMAPIGEFMAEGDDDDIEDPDDSPSPGLTPTKTPKPTQKPAGNVRKYSKAQHAAYQDFKKAYSAMNQYYKQLTYEKAKKASDDTLLKLHEEFQKALLTYQGRTDELAGVVGYTKSISWKVKLEYDIKVDFR